MVRTAIKTLPRGSTALNEAYNEAIERIESQLPEESKLAKTVLSWISYAMRQLTTKELSHALAVEAGESELDEDNIPDIEDVISVCAGLVTVDEESDVVRLVHYTTQEYFERVREGLNPKAQEEIASTCLTYLSFQTFSTGHCNSDEEFESRILQNPFLNYAARYWGTHALPVQQAVKELALPFLCNMNQLSCSTQIMLITDYRYFDYSQSIAKNQTGLHVAAVFGMAYLLQELMPSDGNKDCIHIHARDSSGRDDVVFDSKDTEGWTPLSWAARSGHEAIVKLLVKRDDVIADLRDNSGRTPLLWAAQSGHEAVVKLLLDRDDVVADSKDNDGRTLLSYAAREGHKAIVKLLIKRGDVVADSKDNDGRTPLSIAAEGDNEEIVQLFLKRSDVDPNSEDNNGRTPFWWAVNSRTGIEGREAVVKLLLEQDIIPDSKDKDGRTPLSIAAARGYRAGVRLLLKRNDVDPNSKDNNGCTPLWWAAQENEGDKYWLTAEKKRKAVERREAVAKILTDRIAEDKKKAQTEDHIETTS